MVKRGSVTPEGGTNDYFRYLEAVPDGVVVTERDGHILYVNQQLEAMSGYAREELLGKPVEILVPSRIQGRHHRHREAYHTSEPAHRAMGSALDIRFQRKDGTQFPADIALSPLRSKEDEVLVVAAVRDITERRRADAALHESQERFRLAVEGVTDYAIFMLDLEGNVMTWNPGAQKIKGYGSEEVLGRHFSIFYTPEDVNRGKPERDLRKVTEKGRVAEEGWRLRKDGSRFWASVVISVLKDQEGGLRGFSKITRDITERKRTEDQLRGLLKVTQEIVRGYSADDVLQLIARQARGLVDAALAAVITPDPDAGGYVVKIADGEGAARMRGLRVPVASLSSEVLRGGQAVSVRDVEGEGRAFMPAGEARQHGPAMLLPLTVRGRELGLLAVSNPQTSRPFDRGQLRLLEVFAAQAAVAVEYGRVREELRRLAVVEDRERIARELHDGAIQALFGLGMELQAAASVTPDEQMQRRLEAAVVSLDVVIRDLRNYVFGLRPNLLVERQLQQALTALVDEFTLSSKVEAAVDIDPEVAAASGELAADLVQLLQEALANVRHHAEASRCRITLAREDALSVLSVEDDGRGFNPKRTRAGGQGLRNFRERAARLGGTVEVHSRPGAGTRLRIALPLPGSDLSGRNR